MDPVQTEERRETAPVRVAPPARPVQSPPGSSEPPTHNERALPLGAASLIVTPDDGFVASDPDRDSLWISDGERGVHRLQFERGALPSRIALDNEGTAHVVLRGSGELSHVSVRQRGELRRTRVCADPRGVAALPGSSQIIVACEDGRMISFDWRNPSERRERTLERDLRDVVVSGGSVWVSTFRSAVVYRLSEALAIEERIPLPSVRVAGRLPWRASTAWRMIAMSEGRVAVSYQLEDTAQLPTTVMADPSSTAAGVAYYGEDRGLESCGTLVTTEVAILKKGADIRISPPLGRMPLAIDIAEDRRSSTVMVLSAANSIANAGPSGGLIGRPALVAVSEFHTLQSGQVPARCSVTAQQWRSTNGEAVAIATSERSGAALLLRQPAAVVRPVDDRGVSLSARFPEAEDRSNTGHRVFHGVSPWPGVAPPIACASCHPEGLDDGHVWNFPSGPRRTQRLAGMLAGTAPYHWDGDLATTRALVDEVWTRRMGMAALTASQGAVVTQWIESLPSPEAPSDKRGPNIERGRAIFESPEVRCSTCHSGEMFTDNRSIDVGTGGRLQVPSLRAVAHRALYMHDGCAANLLERFTNNACGGGDQHGHTSQLDRSEIDDLIAYLESL